MTIAGKQGVAVVSTSLIDQVKTGAMREIQASDAKTHLPALLDDVEAGETIVITRHGKPVARLVPDEAARRADIRAAIAEMRELGKNTKGATAEELIAWKHEGHRF
jgi:prevent-host-death family protein